MSEAWDLVRSGQGEPAWNMAYDEALLLGVASRSRPMLRFYSWHGSPASFGYFQRYAEVATMTPLRPLVRRPTGGGLVPHAADWTYSLAFPPTHSWYQLKAVESYRRVHEWIVQSFQPLAVATVLAPEKRAAASGQCFIGAEQFDVLWEEKKIAGAAQRRTRDGLLIQGSIQAPPGIERATWEESFCRAATRSWSVQWIESSAAPDIEQTAQLLVESKYGRDDFNRRR